MRGAEAELGEGTVARWHHLPQEGEHRCSPALGAQDSLHGRTRPQFIGHPRRLLRTSPSPAHCAPQPRWGTRGGAVTQGSKPFPCPSPPGPSPGGLMSGHAESKALRAGGMT